MTQLVNKLGEPQAKVRDEAVAILLRLASAKNVGVAFVASHLMKRSKKPLGLKFLQGRLLVMKDLVAKFDLIADSDHSVGGIMTFLEDNNCFAHQNREIRDPAKELSVALYQVRTSHFSVYGVDVDARCVRASVGRPRGRRVLEVASPKAARGVPDGVRSSRVGEGLELAGKRAWRKRERTEQLWQPATSERWATTGATPSRNERSRRRRRR